MQRQRVEHALETALERRSDQTVPVACMNLSWLTAASLIQFFLPFSPSSFLWASSYPISKFLFCFVEPESGSVVCSEDPWLVHFLFFLLPPSKWSYYSEVFPCQYIFTNPHFFNDKLIYFLGISYHLYANFSQNFFPGSSSLLSSNLAFCFQMHTPCMPFWCIKMNKTKTQTHQFSSWWYPLLVQISLSYWTLRLWIFLSMLSLTSSNKRYQVLFIFSEPEPLISFLSLILPLPCCCLNNCHMLPTQFPPLVVPLNELIHIVRLNFLKHNLLIISPSPVTSYIPSMPQAKVKILELNSQAIYNLILI